MAHGIFGQHITDQYETINFDRLRRERVEKARAQMKKDGLGAVLCFLNENIRYLSSFYPGLWSDPGGTFWCLLPRTGDPALSPMGSLVGVLKEDMPWLKGRIYPAAYFRGWGNGPEKVIADLLYEAGVKDEPVGLDGAGIGGADLVFLLQDVFKKLGIKIVPAQQTMLKARMVKTKDEIELMRMATNFADAGFDALRANIRPGVTERQLQAVVMKAAFDAGADYLRPPLICSGYRTNPNRLVASDKPVRPGEIIFADLHQIACCGYFTCYYRCFTCGRATQQQKEAYHRAYEMQYAGMAKIKAGNTTFDIESQWPKPEYWGCTTWEEIGVNAVGHGLGLNVHEPPRMGRGWAERDPVTLEEGIVIATEVWEPTKDGTEGCRIEEETAITKDGYDLLTKWPIKEITEAWV